MLSTVVLGEPVQSLATVELMVAGVGSVSLVGHLHAAAHQVAILGTTLAVAEQLTCLTVPGRSDSPRSSRSPADETATEESPALSSSGCFSGWGLLLVAWSCPSGMPPRCQPWWL